MARKSMENKMKQTRKLTTCAMLSALGVVLLWLGSATAVMEISMAVLASLCCVLAVIEYGKSTPWLIYAVTGALALILLPQKSTALMYLLFFGYYPILKEKFEKKPRWLSWVLKEVSFHAALIILLLLYKFIFTPAAADPFILYLLAVLLAEFVFPLYDIALTRLISLYLIKLRSRFRFK